ncbi:hypothetical protein T310_6813, partial [Rasamsonia emersonii CBS 393.64]
IKNSALTSRMDVGADVVHCEDCIKQCIFYSIYHSILFCVPILLPRSSLLLRSDLVCLSGLNNIDNVPCRLLHPLYLHLLSFNLCDIQDSQTTKKMKFDRLEDLIVPCKMSLDTIPPEIYQMILKEVNTLSCVRTIDL